MRFQSKAACRSLGVTLGVMLFAGCSSAFAQSKSQVLVLPNPTPREIDPHLLYHDDPSLPPATRKAIAAQAEKRRELILWAANELVVLAERAQNAASAPPDGAAKAALASNAVKIEALAKNLASALKAP